MRAKELKQSNSPKWFEHSKMLECSCEISARWDCFIRLDCVNRLLVFVPIILCVEDDMLSNSNLTLFRQIWRIIQKQTMMKWQTSISCVSSEGSSLLGNRGRWITYSTACFALLGFPWFVQSSISFKFMCFIMEGCSHVIWKVFSNGVIYPADQLLVIWG